ncbi:hypothetical protein SALBM217S_06764 [Streptomyces griseoloalbus]
MLLPVLFALGAALSNALATVLQRKAALTVPSPRGCAGLILDLLRRPVWLIGIVVVITAGVCQAVALATGPITVVQPLFVLELPLARGIATAVLQGVGGARGRGVRRCGDRRGRSWVQGRHRHVLPRPGGGGPPLHRGRARPGQLRRHPARPRAHARTPDAQPGGRGRPPRPDPA